jgi:hypothetical protein
VTEPKVREQPHREVDEPVVEGEHERTRPTQDVQQEQPRMRVRRTSQGIPDYTEAMMAAGAEDTDERGQPVKKSKQAASKQTQKPAKKSAATKKTKAPAKKSAAAKKATGAKKDAKTGY